MTRHDQKQSLYPMSEPAPQWLLLSLALGFLAVFVALPLCSIFAQAFQSGWGAYVSAVSSADARAAVRLTLLVAAIALPVNLLFGLAASWTLARHHFRGRGLILALIDLPIAVSPVVSGLVFVLLFGARGVLGPWLDAHHLKIVFAVPGIVLATVFVTFPYVARELIPVMESQGRELEEAAGLLGAKGWQTYWRVTLPNIRWALMYGVVLSNARAMGEFGAVSVVSGHVSGLTNTIPLHIELLYNEYDFVGAFAVASLLSLLALITLAVRALLDWHAGRRPMAASA